MKSRLRKIIIDGSEYLYSVSNKYHSGTNTLTIRVFLSGQKKTPLIIDFSTFDDYYGGQPLNSGIRLANKRTNKTDLVNINEPKYIRELILHGLKNGWSVKSKIENQDGLNYLSELGYEASVLKPKVNLKES
jgi:hypothetical protein